MKHAVVYFCLWCEGAHGGKEKDEEEGKKKKGKKIEQKCRQYAVYGVNYVSPIFPIKEEVMGTGRREVMRGTNNNFSKIFFFFFSSIIH